MDKVTEYRDRFNSENSICLIWCIADIKTAMQNRDHPIEITDDECMEILDEMERRHDASLGITWDTIEYYLDEFTQRKLTKLGHKIKNYGMEEYHESEV